MSEIENKTVTVSVPMNAALKIQTAVKVRSLKAPDKIINASKALAIWWFAAVLFVFVPVFHFFLVPLSFIIGIVDSYRRAQLSYRFLDQTLDCPNCKAQFSVDTRAFNWPKRTECPKCLARLLIDED